MTNSDSTSDKLCHLIPRSRERLTLKHSRLGGVLVYLMSLSEKVVSSI
jgi:hypothetical protein